MNHSDTLSQFSLTTDYFKNSILKKENNEVLEFNNLIEEFKRYTKPDIYMLSKVELLERFTNLTADLYKLKDENYPKMLAETKQIIEDNKHKIEFSTFELMEHNFRENTHSNILQHLFHHKYIDEGGEKILSEFIRSFVKKDDDLPELILKKEYEIIREFNTSDNRGRIDLLITDEINKFVIVIENKILADIGVKEQSEEGNITKTQLHLYEEYVLENIAYKEYKKCFILLSFKSVSAETDLSKFEIAKYEDLLNIIDKIESRNNILIEYKKLLTSLIKGTYDKEELIDLISEIRNGGEPDIYDLELINKYYA